MTAFIPAINMCISRLAALMAFCNNILCYPFTQPLIKNEIFSDKFIRQLIIFYGVCIMDDTTFKVKNMVKAMMKHISAGFFTPDTSCAIHDYVLVLFLFENVNGHW